MGLVCVLEGNEGSSLGVKATWYKGLPQPNEAEARDLKESINWLGNLRFPMVSIELDCKQVVDDSSSNLSTNSMFGVILNRCKVSLLNHQNFNPSFIRKQANNSAHLLAKVLLSYTSSHVHDYMSSCITTVVMK